MKIERCPSGHFYDAGRYDRCPCCPQEIKAPVEAELPVSPPLPLAGWLVAISGAGRGCEFRLYPGYNYIGSAPDMDIVLPGDPAVFPDRAAVLGYDDRLQLFSFGPCGGRQPVRVNGAMILDAVVLQAYDRLTVGGTELLFVPLCGKHFHWNDTESEIDRGASL